MDNYKEYLDPKDGYALVKQSVNMPRNPDWIEIPNGAELMTAAGKELVFWKGNGQYSWHTENSNEWEKAGFGLSDLESYLDEYSKIVWELNKQVGKDPALISGAEAYDLIGKRVDVEALCSQGDGTFKWEDAKHLPACDILNDGFEFRLKPQTIKLELELPKPFEPKDGDIYWFITCRTGKGYSCRNHKARHGDSGMQFGAYRTEDEIKQVVEQLRKIRGTNS